MLFGKVLKCTPVSEILAFCCPNPIQMPIQRRCRNARNIHTPHLQMQENVRNAARPHSLPQPFSLLQNLFGHGLHRADIFMALIFKPFELAGSVPSQPISQRSLGDCPLLSLRRDVYASQNLFARCRFLGHIQAVLQ
jgi:hypothetical protein